MTDPRVMRPVTGSPEAQRLCELVDVGRGALVARGALSDGDIGAHIHVVDSHILVLLERRDLVQHHDSIRRQRVRHALLLDSERERELYAEAGCDHMTVIVDLGRLWTEIQRRAAARRRAGGTFPIPVREVL